ncbi:MAG: hypothetical protein M3N23_03635 [Pseudomonadota bacterium]|nr:hypothetical protein [Pseudomonadota bacterium]
MSFIKLCGIVAAAVIVTGCAHPITINPDFSKLERDAAQQPINKSVGYFIAPSVRDLPVETPGGGGDKVTYLPYRDLEPAIYKMLSNVFTGVTRLTSASGDPAVQKNNLVLIVTPKLTTTSSSPSPLTWPPTVFGVELSLDVADAAGKPVMTYKAVGEGKAEFSEFKVDFGLSARRASQDALLKMQKTLLNAPELRK